MEEERMWKRARGAVAFSEIEARVAQRPG